MGLQVVATTGQISQMWRKTPKGKLELVEPSRDEYVFPVDGYYRLRLNGVSESFESTGQYGTQTKTKFEWFVVSAAKATGRPYVGKLFTDMYTLVVSSRSNIGKILAALTGEEVKEGETYDICDYIGYEMDSAVTQETKEKDGQLRTYSNVAVSTVSPATDDEEETPTPIKVAKKSAFADEDDDE
jgi:hypothetical protein